MCPVVGNVVGKLRSLRAIPRHDAHFDGRRGARKASAIHRKPVPFRELEQHRGIAARSHHATCRRVWCKPEFLQVLAAFSASDAIPSVQQVGRSTIGIEHRGRGWKLLDMPTGCLTAVAIAGGADNRSATSLEDDATAGASSGQNLWRTSRPTRLPHSTLRRHTLRLAFVKKLVTHYCGGSQRRNTGAIVMIVGITTPVCVAGAFDILSLPVMRPRPLNNRASGSRSDRRCCQT